VANRRILGAKHDHRRGDVAVDGVQHDHPAFAGLQTIPQLYEAAEIDGANRWEKFRYVTLPQLKPVMLFVVVLSTIGTFKLFAEPYVITGGGPTNSTITIVQYIYRQAFVNFNLGYASALTVVFVAVVSVFSVVQIKIGGED